MLYLPNPSLNPHYNLALEEYAFMTLAPDDTLIMLWQNEPSVIIGRFQNTQEEVNHEFVKEQGIHVVRRITGGGAVYHDLGNLNFTFIEKQARGGQDFRRFTEPIIRVLQEFGVAAQHSGRNDITIEGKKFSGNAQYNRRGRTLHHGTILYNSNLEDVQAALNVKGAKIESKGIKSVRSRVTNICDYLPEKKSIQEFRDTLLHYLFQGDPIREYELTREDHEAINKLMEEKYLKWDWNYGQSPPYNKAKSSRFPWGAIEVRLYVERGYVEECRIYGDFFSSEDPWELIRAVRGVKHEEKELRRVLSGLELNRYFGPVSLDEFLALFI